MFGNVCHGVPGERIEGLIKERKQRAGVELDTELSVDHLRALVDDYKALYREPTGEDFPQDPREQLAQSIRAVFDSWLGERAVEYRRINRIPDDWGTAVERPADGVRQQAASVRARAWPSRATRSRARPSPRATSW